MALTLPSTTDLALFQGEEEVEDQAQAEYAIEMAADLLWLATAIEDDPEDERLARMARNAILDMAWYLLIQTSDKVETYSGHSSERIGSYSYSKAQRAVSLNERTGVFWFDAFRDAITGGANQGPSVFAVSSAHVFPQRAVAEIDVPVSVRTDFFGG